MRIVIAVLVLLFGLKVLSSPAFNSLLASPVSVDYHILPTLALLAFAIPVCIVRIMADSRAKESREAREDEEQKGAAAPNGTEARPGFQQRWQRRENEPGQRD